jgi:hypothetical protein
MNSLENYNRDKKILRFDRYIQRWNNLNGIVWYVKDV